MRSKRVFSQRLGELVKTSRERKGMALRSAAKELGTYLAAVQRLEEGFISDKIIKRRNVIADFCGVPQGMIDKLITEAGPLERDPQGIAKLLVDSRSKVTLDEIRYLATLFRRERWELPTNSRPLLAILDLHRSRKCAARS